MAMVKCDVCGKAHDESLLVTLETIEDNGHVYTVCESCASRWFRRSCVSGQWVYWPEYSSYEQNNYYHLRHRLMHNGLFMLPHEHSYGWHWCEKCGLPSRDTRTVNDAADGTYEVCETCFDWDYMDYEKCEDCGEYFPDTEDMCTSHDGDNICSSCRDAHWHRCSECGELFHEDDDSLRYSDRIDEYVCDDCWDCYRHEYIDEDDMPNRHDYGYKPDGIFHDTEDDKEGSTLYFGTENEHSHDDQSELYHHSEYIYSHYDPSGCACERHFYQKHDSSLEYGTEVVSHPMSLSYWHKIRPHMQKVFAGSRNYTESGCDGLHVHLSRNGMTNGHADRFVMFFEMCKASICDVARRESDEYAAFMNDDAYDAAMAFGTVDALLDAIDKVRLYRYRCVNFDNNRTVEVRVFRSTLYVDEYYSAIEFCHAAYQFTKVHDIQTLYDWGASDALWDCFLNYCADDRRYDTLTCWLAKNVNDMGSTLNESEWPDAVMPRFDDVDTFLSRPLPITGGMLLSRIVATNSSNGVPLNELYEEVPQPASIRQQQMERELSSQLAFGWEWGASDYVYHVA